MSLTIKTAYERVNAAWPAEIPALTAGEATRASSRLFRWALGETFVGEIAVTSGNRSCDVARVGDRWRMKVNPDLGWREFVHHLSHEFYYWANGRQKPHSKDHARVELAMVKEVVKRGWLDGRLKDAPVIEPERGEVYAVKLARLDKRIENWETKLKRASNALKTLHTTRKRLVRRIDKETTGDTA